MRVKVGNQWFAVSKDQPIAVELTHQDRENIANMPRDATRYGIFEGMEPETSRTWLSE